jgi:hypothetical protein
MNKDYVLTSLAEIQQWQGEEYIAFLILKTPVLGSNGEYAQPEIN